LDKTCVFPTSNRVAVEADIGRRFNITTVGVNQSQHVDLTHTNLGVVEVTDVIDDGAHVEVRIPTAHRYGNL